MLVVSELVPGRQPDQRMRSLIFEDFQLIENADGNPELYDLVSDPYQSTDLGRDPDRTADRLRMEGLLRRALGCAGFDCCCAIGRLDAPDRALRPQS